jgi:uncharacterized protein (TIGR02391 family)
VVNLQTHIPERLWQAIAATYENQNYSHAILEATYFLSALLRERAGVDGDGAGLVGQALGGDSPRLKLNLLQTESERNVQKGFEQILRGIYLGIRNPRAHEPSNDTQQTADAIIHFLGHIVSLLSSSKEAFTVDGFVSRAFDPEFVESKRYAELVLSEVPQLRLADAAIGLFRARRKNDLRKLTNLVGLLTGAMSPAQLTSYLSVASDELRTATDETDIRTALQMLPPPVWPQLEELPRLRIENKLTGGIKEGLVRNNGSVTQPLATWSRDFLQFYTQRTEAASALLERLESSNSEARHYAAKFFMRSLPGVMTQQHLQARCIQALVNAVNADDANVSEALIAAIYFYPEDWQKKLGSALKSKTDENNPGSYLSDGSPFLSSPANDESDEFPF